MTITELSIKRPTIVVVIFSVLSVLGIYGYLQLNYDLLPNLTAPVITIQTVYPGGSPNSVENSVTKVIEDAITGIEKISAIRSTSSEGFSLVVVEFDMDADIDKSLQEAQRKINQILNKLPSTAKQPVISKISFDEIPVLRLTLNSNLDEKEFTQFIKDKIQPRFTKLKGVGLVSLIGANEREIKINVNADKLKAYNLNLFNVTQIIKNQNLDFPTGNIKGYDNQYVVRVAGKFDNIKAVVLGKFKKLNVRKSFYPNRAMTILEVITEIFKPLGVPCVYDFPFGHITSKLTLPIGVAATIDADKKTFQITEPAVI